MPSAMACRTSRDAGPACSTASRSTRSHLRIDAHPASRAMADWLVAYLTKRRADPEQAQPLLRHRSRRHLRRHRPAAHVDRGAAGLDAAIAGAFLRARRAGHPARGRRPRLSQCRRDRGAGARRRCWPSRSRISACSRRRGRRWSMPRRISASRFSVDQDQFLSIAKIRALRRLWARVAGGLSPSRPRAATIHAETSYRMMTALDPETNILRTTIAGFRGGRRRRGFDLDPAAHDRAWPAGRLCAARRPQHPARPGRRKPRSTSSPIRPSARAASRR